MLFHTVEFRISLLFQVIRPVLNLGVLGELLLVFPEYEVVELTVLAKVLLGMYPFSGCLSQVVIQYNSEKKQKELVWRFFPFKVIVACYSLGSRNSS